MKHQMLPILSVVTLLSFQEASFASKIECVESLKKRSNEISFYDSEAASYLELYDPLEKIIYLYPKVEGQPDYTFFLVTEDDTYRVDHKPTVQSGALHSNPNSGPPFFVAQDKNGKVISLFKSAVESPLDKFFSLKALPVEEIAELKKGRVAKVTVEPLKKSSDLKAVEDSFVISYWSAWENSVPSKGGIKDLFGSTEEGWDEVKENCSPYFQNIETVEMKSSCYRGSVCGTIVKKSAPGKKLASDDEAELTDADESEEL